MSKQLIAVSAFFAGLTVSFFTLPLWVTVLSAASVAGPRTDWLGFAASLTGSLITAGVAAAAIYYAWRGIRMQMMISLISREEERMENTLPGLEAAFGFLARVQTEMEAKTEDLHYIDVLGRQGLNLDQHKMRIEVGKRLPTTDANTSLYVTQIMNLLVLRSNELHTAFMERMEERAKTRFEIPTNDEACAANRALDIANRHFELAFSDFKRLVSSINERILLFRKRLPEFRSRIEESFE